MSVSGRCWQIFITTFIKAACIQTLYLSGRGMNIASVTNNLKKAASCGWPKVVLFGDSITQYSFSHDGCWGALLADRLQRKCDVINRGFSGYNTRWNKLILPRLIDASSAKDISAVTIFLGANDSNRLDLNPRQHVPLDEYKQNLLDMVDYLMSVGISHEKVVLIAPPPCDEAVWGEECKLKERPMSKCATLTEKYAKACCSAASESGARCVDLYTEMMKQSDWQKFLNDGLHLSAAGSTFLDSLLWPHIEKLTSHLPVILPTWDEVDHENPEKSLQDN